MTVAAVKEKLHNYIDEANGNEAKAMLDFIENTLPAKEYEVDDETLSIAQERLEKYLKGESKGYTLEESINRARKHIRK